MKVSELLVDTNIVIYTLGGRQELADHVAGKRLYASVITRLETLSYPGLSVKEEAKVKRYFERCVLLPLREDIQDMAVRFRRAYKLRLADAIVAASAAVLDVPLLTADRTFERLVGELAVEIYLPEG